MWKKRPEDKPDRPLKTLDRVLSFAGLCSRTEARSWIGKGRVSVNRQVVQTPDHWVDLVSDTVELDGRAIQAKTRRYLLLYKPTGYLTTYKDPENRATVYDLLEGVPDFLFPVGRLDRDTSGLLLMTNDAVLAERITNPDFKVPKTYMVKAAGELSPEQFNQLKTGVELEDGMSLPAEVKRLRGDEKNTFLELTIREGRNRQVRRMLDAVGSRVRKLVRISIGPLRIGPQTIGTWRQLTREEVASLWDAVGGRPAQAPSPKILGKVAERRGAPRPERSGGAATRRTAERGTERRSYRAPSRASGGNAPKDLDRAQDRRNSRKTAGPGAPAGNQSAGRKGGAGEDAGRTPRANDSRGRGKPLSGRPGDKRQGGLSDKRRGGPGGKRPR